MHRNLLLHKLVCTNHLNVPERQELGKITRDEVVAVVLDNLNRSGCFPPHARDPGAVYEGAIIERQRDGRYLTLLQRASVYDPCVVAEKKERYVNDPQSAVRWYIATEWQKKNIDGIPFA